MRTLQQLVLLTLPSALRKYLTAFVNYFSPLALQVCTFWQNEERTNYFLKKKRFQHVFVVCIFCCKELNLTSSVFRTLIFYILNGHDWKKVIRFEIINLRTIKEKIKIRPTRTKNYIKQKEEKTLRVNQKYSLTPSIKRKAKNEEQSLKKEEWMITTCG